MKFDSTMNNKVESALKTIYKVALGGGVILALSFLLKVQAFAC
ncbi:MAG: hypothetical protein QY318_00625 [Candidatus Dojkabacteria bacterium]|nr:MAG: hypothetical protein QY318_00625 [Candidatus Dojkabacteria bacterium]